MTGNPNHSPTTGQFTSGNDAAATGDHQGAQPSNKNMRNVPGHGLVRRSQPVAMHNHAESIGTGADGGGGSSGGGGGGGGGRLRKKATVHGNPGGTGSEKEWSEIRHQHFVAATK